MLLVWLMHIILGYIIFIMKFVAALHVPIGGFGSWYAVAAYYAVLFAVLLYHHDRKTKAI
ncbi:MAG: hypothetical protein Q7S28_01290, partial [bacterium]|nr:hypothetical protein [bacterium]